MPSLPDGYEILEKPKFKLWGPGRIPVLMSVRVDGNPHVEVLVDVSVNRVPAGAEIHGTRLMRGHLDAGDIYVTTDDLLSDPPEEAYIDELCRAAAQAAILIKNHPKPEEIPAKALC
jgi:hypothetical protein